MTTVDKPAATRRISYVPALDGMRGVSLPGTIYTHFQIFLGGLSTAPRWIRSSGPFTLNIEMFFVLSGALITSLLVSEFQRSGTVALDRFYLRRSRRLGPALVAIVPLLLLVQFGLPGSSSPPLGSHPWVTAVSILLFVGNWELFRGGNIGWLGPAWTLGIEEQFYLTWPMLLRASLRRGWPRRRVLGVLWGGIVAASIFGAFASVHFGGSRAFAMTPTQAPPILMGCALGYALTTHSDGWFVRLLASPLVALAGLAGMVIVSILAAQRWLVLEGGGYAVYGALACLLIGHCFVAADRPSFVSRVFGWRPFVVVGKVSYEAYLVHCVVILGVLRVAPHMTVTHMVMLDTLLIAAISGVFYYLIERPIRRYGWLAAFRGRGQPVARPASAVMARPVRPRRGLLVGMVSATAAIVLAAVAVVTIGHSTSSPERAAAGAQSTTVDAGSQPGPAPDAGNPSTQPGSPGGTSPASARPSTPSTDAVVLTASEPTVRALSPTAGPLHGGTLVAISGRHLGRVTQVLFGSVPAQRFTVVSSRLIRAVAPSRLRSADVSISLLGADHRTAASCSGCSALFSYLPVPTVTAMMPLVGSIRGGATITLDGTGFAQGAGVYFGMLRATHVTVVNARTIEVTAPPARALATTLPSAVHDLHGLSTAVTVRTAGGVSQVSSAIHFTYL